MNEVWWRDTEPRIVQIRFMKIETAEKKNEEMNSSGGDDDAVDVDEIFCSAEDCYI